MADFPATKGLKDLFEAQVARTPDAVAVSCAGEQLTYRQLNARANRWAALLIEAGVGPDDVVPLLSHRGIPLLTAMLAVFKAGGAYLPMDPNHPPERLKQVLEQLSPKMCLVASAQASLLDQAVALLSRPLKLAQLEALPLDAAPNPPTRTAPRSLAYVIFTSGSTGAPKGAMVEQLGMVNHLFEKLRELSLGSNDAVAQTASQCFDISVWQLFSALAVGGRTVIYPDAVTMDPKALARETQTRGVTILELVPSMLAAVLDAGSEPLKGLRCLVATGEALPPELCRRWFREHSIPLLNAYGPTECSDDVTHQLLRAPPDATLTPIGTALANVRLYVLDEALRPVRKGDEGELYVGGICVGRGYVGRADLTAERFVPDPFEGGGTRMYRTGDLVREVEGGALVFLGRIDFQVKLRGFRIELGEIEARLLAMESVKDAVVAAREDAAKEQLLAAYIVPKPGATLTAESLKTAVGKTLPVYMVPAAFVFLDALPLTPNGKVDRKALPAPTVAAPAPASPAAETLTDVEKKIARLWMKIRKTDRVGRNDDFLNTGGNSLTLMQLSARVSELFDIELPVGLVFDAPSVAGVAKLVEAALANSTGGTEGKLSGLKVTQMPGSRAGEVPLSFTEERHLRLWKHARDTREPIAGRLASERLVLDGPMNVDALREAIKHVMRRHDLLRSLYVLREDGTFSRRILDQVDPPLVFKDFRGEADPEAAAFAAVDEELPKAFDLTTAPGIRWLVFTIGPDRHIFMQRVDHIVADEEGSRTILAELRALYRQFAFGEPAPTFPTILQYADFALWQRAVFSDAAELPRERAHWQQKLKGAQPLTNQLPTDRPRAPLDARRAEHPLTPTLVSGVMKEAPGIGGPVAEFARAQKVTVFAVAFAAAGVMFRRRVKNDELLFCSLNDYRRRVDGLDGVVGTFNNSTLLRLSLAQTPTWAELVQRAQATMTDLLSRPEFPLIPLLYPRLSDEFRVMFNFVPLLGGEGGQAEWPRCTAKRFFRPHLNKGFKSIWDMNLTLYGAGDTFELTIMYNAELWDAPTMQALVGEYFEILRHAVANPDAKVETAQ